ncbi:hypothetical protein [Clostridium sp.]|uniref:hypothetical protein n=1 Tax=Clostridium sp. TaxID=1506 RepID=UPI002627EF5A|nr:hypothetical protein [Clostridium sp.]
MQYTANFGLKKPEDTDKVNQEDFNFNSDVIDKKLNQGQQALGIIDILMQGSGLIDPDGNNIIDPDGNNIVS